MLKRERISKLFFDAKINLAPLFQDRFFGTAFLMLATKITHRDLDKLEEEYKQVLERQQKGKTVWDPSRRGGSEKRV